MFKLKRYTSLKGYLLRFTILKIGRLHIRIHHIRSDDKTPFFHNHPFHYASIILSGGYTEQSKTKIKKYSKWNIILRSDSFFHRIEKVQPNTKTLFITWITKKPWSLEIPQYEIHCPEWIDENPGIYKRTLSGKEKYAKFDKYWHISHENINDALKEMKPSVNQYKKGDFIMSIF